jgi:hypothetical protein
MRKVVVGGLGFAAVAWVLGSADWRPNLSEMWTTARAQLRGPETMARYDTSVIDASSRFPYEPASRA